MKAVVFLVHGFEEGEVLMAADVLRRAEVGTVMIYVMKRLKV